MRKEYKIEICANSVESALEAQKGGADRIELCAGIPEGGTTPSYGEIRMARELLSIRLHVIIRPRSGDFLYTPLEQSIMLHDIENARLAGADGIVIGCLTPAGEIDLPLTERFIKAANGLSVTFHRAFDMCRNPEKALEEIISLGCTRLLTSGQQVSAEQGILLLKKLQQQANGRIIIMPGCGINADNIHKIATETETTEFHFSARSFIESNMIYRNPHVLMGGTVKIEEYKKEITDALKVKETLQALL